MTDLASAPAPATSTAPLEKSGTPPPEDTTPAPASTGGAQPGDVSSAAKEAMRKYKVKVEGKELEVDESELLRGYSHQKVASKTLNEGKALRKQAEDLIGMLKDEARLNEVLEKLGHNPRKLYEKQLAAQLEDDLMDPRDKELRDTKARLQHLEDLDRKQKEDFQKKRHDELKTKYMKEYEADFVKALETEKLPPTKPMVAEMAKYIHRAAKIGFELSPKEAAQMVGEDLDMMRKRISADADGETLLRLLGEDVANKIRKYDTAKIKSPEANLLTPQNQVIEGRQKIGARKQPMTQREWQLHKRGLK